MRPAPRRAPRGRSGSRVQWDKLGRVALVLVLFVILALYVRPVLGFVDAWTDSKAERAQLHDLQREHARLRARATSLDDPGAADRAARKLGMVAPGETSYSIRGLR